MFPPLADNTVDLQLVRGREAGADTAPALVIEVPHGATDAGDFDAWASALEGPLPDDLQGFFHVNTDAGAPELAEAVARRFTEVRPDQAALVIRCRVPRTFVDCNRMLDVGPDAFREAGVTPGLPPWIRETGDHALLRQAWSHYQSTVDAAIEGARDDARILLLHTFAPRTVDVQVDLDVVANLRAAWAPEKAQTWPLRPEVEVIGRDTEGVDHAPAKAVLALRLALGPLGVPVAESATWPLHPSTLAWHRTMAHPGRVLCVEIRRDLLAAAWTPMEPLEIDPGRVALFVEPLVDAIRAWS